MNEPRQYRDMTRDELVDLVGNMRWAALDLAQHLSFTNELLSPPAEQDTIQPDRRAAYEQAQVMAYGLLDDQPSHTAGVAAFGAQGLVQQADEGRAR